MGDYLNAYINTKEALKTDNVRYNNWYNLSFYALFVGKPEESIQAAQKVLSLAPEQVCVETNLALGYLLNNQYSEAEKIYQKWKSKSFPDDERLCDDIFLADIADLEQTGIMHSDFEKGKNMFKK